VTSAAAQITPSHPAFGQVAALFDDYRRRYGQPPSPQLARDWLHSQLARHRMTITAALHAGQARGFITATVMPASLTLGTAWSIRDLYVAPSTAAAGSPGPSSGTLSTTPAPPAPAACPCRPRSATLPP